MSNRIYIGNLESISKKEIEDYVSQFGQIIDLLFKNNYAFVEYKTNQEAETALRKLDGYLLQGKRLKAQIAKSANQQKDIQLSIPRLYIGRIAEANITKYDLQQLFQPFGEIDEILLKEDYAFIQYKNLESAQAAKQLHNTIVNGQKIVVQEAKVKDPENEQGTTRLYIGRINSEITREDLTQLFSPFGEILEISMKTDFAFVEYSNKSSAQQALEKMNQFQIKGTKILVQEAKGPKNDRNDRKNQSQKTSQKHHSKYQHNNRRDSGRRDRDRSYSSGSSGYDRGGRRRNYSRSRSRSYENHRRRNQSYNNNNQNQKNSYKQKFSQRNYNSDNQQQQQPNYQKSQYQYVPQQQNNQFFQPQQQQQQQQQIQQNPLITPYNNMIPASQDMMSYYQQPQPSGNNNQQLLIQQQPVQQQISQQQQFQLWQKLNSDSADF